MSCLNSSYSRSRQRGQRSAVALFYLGWINVFVVHQSFTRLMHLKYSHSLKKVLSLETHKFVAYAYCCRNINESINQSIHSNRSDQGLRSLDRAINARTLKKIRTVKPV